MTVQELLNAIQSTAGTNGSQREVCFRAMFDIGAHSSAGDFEKEVVLKFSDCIVKSDHPNQIEIIVC